MDIAVIIIGLMVLLVFLKIAKGIIKLALIILLFALLFGGYVTTQNSGKLPEVTSL